MTYRVLDDLNSLYVNEAKIFFWVTQRRQGAERLIESRVLAILADSDFLDTLPEAGQSFNGMSCRLLRYW